MMLIIATIRREILELPVSEKKLKDFAFLVGGIIVALGLFSILREGGGPWVYGAVAAGLILVLLGFAAPQTLLFPYRAWMSIGIILGFFVFRVLLVVIFFAVFTPFAFVMRLMGRDVMRLKPPKNASTFWISAEKPQDMREPY